MIIKTGVVRVVGKDAYSFLQSLLSNDLSNLEVKASIKSLFLTPVGKVLSTMFVYRAGDDEFLLVCEPSTRDNLEASLKKLCIRTEAEISDVSDEYVAKLESENLDSMTYLLETAHGVSHLSLYLSSLQSASDVVDDREKYDQYRISHAIMSASDLGDDAIAQEAALEVDAVSFDKGCFIGQELVCRIDSRGTPTPFTYFAFKLSSFPSSLDNLEVRINDDMAGEVTSISHNVNSDKDFGSWHTIAKVKRSWATQMLQTESDLELELYNGNEKADVVQYRKVPGLFCC